jgi:hypothetical protein
MRKWNCEMAMVEKTVPSLVAVGGSEPHKGKLSFR